MLCPSIFSASTDIGLISKVTLYMSPVSTEMGDCARECSQPLRPAVSNPLWDENDTGQRAVALAVLPDWEGNWRFGITQAMHHRLLEYPPTGLVPALFLVLSVRTIATWNLLSSDVVLAQSLHAIKHKLYEMDL